MSEKTVFKPHVNSPPFSSIEKVCTGCTLLKFPKHGAPSFRHVFLTEDLKYVTWSSKKKSKDIEETRMFLQSCNFELGQKTMNFKRQNRTDLESLSFSLINVQSRTLDLVCKDKDELDTWVEALSYLCEYGPPQKLTTNQDTQNLQSRSFSNWQKITEKNSSLNNQADHNESIRSQKSKVDETEEGLKRTVSTPMNPRERIKDSNSLYSFGFGGLGQLGNGDTTNQIMHTPTLISALLMKEVRSVSCGYDHSVCILSSGELYSWGNAGNGRLGLGLVSKVKHGSRYESKAIGKSRNDFDVLTYVSVPSKITFDFSEYGGTTLSEEKDSMPVCKEMKDHPKIISVACGSFHTLACCSEGRVYSWGGNSSGQLGLSDTLDRLTPVLIESMKSNMIEVAATSISSISLCKDGGLFTWGANEFDTLGRPESDVDIFSTPSSIPSESFQGYDITSVCAGAFHVVALGISRSSTERGLFTWGFGGTGALGHGNYDNQTMPTLVKALHGKDMRSIAAGDGHTAVIVNEETTNSRVLFTFGSSKCGQLGRNNHNMPQSDSTDADSVVIDSSREDQKRQQSVLSMSQVKVDVDSRDNLPGVVSALLGQDVESVNCGGFHTVCISDTGLYAFGDNTYGQLGFNKVEQESINSYISEPIKVQSISNRELRQVSCGGRHTCVTVGKEWLKDDDTPACMRCARTFTVINRRHHCRNCGGIYCKRCSSNRHALLKHGHIDPVRVCNNCYETLST